MERNRIKPKETHHPLTHITPLRFLIIVITSAAMLLGPLTLSSKADPDITDANITSAISTELWTNEAVDANNINVQTNNGVVTLTGSVDNILSKEYATKIARSISGVTSIVNTIDVMPSIELTDAELQQAVQEAILEDPATDAYEVSVSVTDGQVILTGNVDSWHEKKLCGLVAKGVRGVRGVTNDIVADFTLDRPDFDIEPEIEARLAYDVRVDDYLIDVEVEDGEVELSGTVGSLSEKQTAIQNAWVNGVSSVDAENLDVEYWARDKLRRKSLYISQSDEEIKQAIKTAFAYDPRVYSFNPIVEVEDGTVVLSGVVDNLQAKRAAEQDARNTVGVWRVKNYLKVQPEVIPPDATLEERVEQALKENPYVSYLDVNVDALVGWVTLTGEVNSSFERNVAEEVASRVKGVTGVTNNLDFKYTWIRKPDWELREDVRDELFWNPYVDAEQVNVSVDEGVVTLSGSVDTWSEKLNAGTDAWQSGAKDVDNNLTVQYRFYGPYPSYWPHVVPDNTGVDNISWN